MSCNSILVCTCSWVIEFRATVTLYTCISIYVYTCLPATMLLQKQLEGVYWNLGCILYTYFPQPGKNVAGVTTIMHLDLYLWQFFENSENALSESWVHLISTVFSWWQWIEVLMSSWSPVNGPKSHVSIVSTCKKRKKRKTDAPGWARTSNLSVNSRTR